MENHFKIFYKKKRNQKLKPFSINNTATVNTENGAIKFGIYAATLAANTYPKPYPKHSNTKPIYVDNISANTAANKPTIVASIALDSAPNNSPIKLLFVVSTASNNGASNKYPLSFFSKVCGLGANNAPKILLLQMIRSLED